MASASRFWRRLLGLHPRQDLDLRGGAALDVPDPGSGSGSSQRDRAGNRSAGAPGMMRLADVRPVRVPRGCVDGVHAHMRKVGRDGFEGLGLWAGRQAGDTFTVEEAIIPAQKHIRTEDGVCVITGPEELHRLNVWLYRKKLS